MKSCNLDHPDNRFPVIPACFWRESTKGRTAVPAKACPRSPAYIWAGLGGERAGMTEGEVEIKETERLPQLLNSSTLQLFNSSTLQLFNSSTLQLFNSSTLQLFNSSTLQLFNSPLPQKQFLPNQFRLLGRRITHPVPGYLVNGHNSQQ